MFAQAYMAEKVGAKPHRTLLNSIPSKTDLEKSACAFKLHPFQNRFGKIGLSF
jgi:hypothetical protein